MSTKLHYSELQEGREYYVICLDTNVIIRMGTLVRFYKDQLLDRFCWHDGPIYTTAFYEYMWVDATDSALANELGRITPAEMERWTKEYDGFYLM